jgi:hypothetical protein
VQGGRENNDDMAFVVNASRMSSHAGANRFIGSIARAGSFAQCVQYIMDQYYGMHRCTLGLHSPAMDVAFQMQGMPKIASMIL